MSSVRATWPLLNCTWECHLSSVRATWPLLNCTWERHLSSHSCRVQGVGALASQSVSQGAEHKN